MLNPLDALLCLEMFDTAQAASKLVPDRVIFIDAPAKDDIRPVGALFSRCDGDDVELAISDIVCSVDHGSLEPKHTSIMRIPKSDYRAVPISQLVGDDWSSL